MHYRRANVTRQRDPKFCESGPVEIRDSVGCNMTVASVASLSPVAFDSLVNEPMVYEAYESFSDTEAKARPEENFKQSSRSLSGQVNLLKRFCHEEDCNLDSSSKCPSCLYNRMGIASRQRNACAAAELFPIKRYSRLGHGGNVFKARGLSETANDQFFPRSSIFSNNF